MLYRRHRALSLGALFGISAACSALAVSCSNDFDVLLSGETVSAQGGQGGAGQGGADQGGAGQGGAGQGGSSCSGGSGGGCGDPQGCVDCGDTAPNTCFFQCDVCGSTCAPFSCNLNICSGSCGPETTCNAECDEDSSSCSLGCEGCAGTFRCESGQCDLACSDGADCDTRCTEDAFTCNLKCIGSKCVHDCDSASCTSVCEAGSECDVKCENFGSCALTCAAGAKCLFECDPLFGGCSLNCEGATPISCGANKQACHYDACP
ncbi:MAG: hypothetical protein HUU21_16630 [Polyangiaceae bacterium]|nr:hypothetical protein [Polyangiaceae bacterium]